MTDYDRDRLLDYLFYLTDTIALIIALLFSATEAYTAYTTGQPFLIKVGLMGLAWFFRYVYIIYYTVSKFFLA